MIRLCINLCSDGTETPNRQNQHLLCEHKVEEVVMDVFKLLRDSKDESHYGLMQEISMFFQTYCMQNGDNQAIMANHITNFVDGERIVRQRFFKLQNHYNYSRTNFSVIAES